MRIVTLLATLVVSVACSSSRALAEVDYLAEIYGEGVHYYYAGDLCKAQRYFDQAIANGYQDPRCYYYRAMLHMRTCNDHQAEQDIKTGARFELEGRGTYDIGRALYRIQGHQRIKFERYRRDAKLELASSRPVPSSPMQPFNAPTTTIDPELPSIPPSLTDPFADDVDDIEEPVDDDPAAEIDADDMFEDTDPTSSEGPVDGPSDDATPSTDAETTDDLPADDDPFGSDDDPFADGDDNLFDGF